MIEVQSYPIAVLLCALAMVCWGSWQNTQNLAGKSWRFELFYWDFTLGIVLLSLFAALTAGSLGNVGRTFMEDLSQASMPNIVNSMIGGAIWNLGTLLLVTGIALTGMSVAFPIGGGIGWILGIFINYLEKPDGNLSYLLIGAFFIVIAIFLSVLANAKLPNEGKKSMKGVVFSFLAGLAIAFFYRFVAISIDPDFTVANAGKLSNYTATFFFTLGALICTAILNPIFMNKPVQGEPVNFGQYFAANFKTHLYGILGGGIWCLGMVFSFMAVKAAGPAISYGLSNGAPIVAALWGIFVWKEFKNAPKSVNPFLAGMFACYVIGLGFIVYSRF